MLINMTPHPLAIRMREEVIRLAPSGIVPRCSASRMPCDYTDGIQTVRTTLGSVVDLPDAKEGVYLIVSALVMNACPDRADLRSPGEAVRDAAGVIVGCNGLCCA